MANVTTIIDSYLDITPVFIRSTVVISQVLDYVTYIDSFIHLYPTFQDNSLLAEKDVDLNVLANTRTGFSPFTVRLTPDITINSLDLNDYTSVDINFNIDTSRTPISKSISTSITSASINLNKFYLDYDFSGYKGKTYDITAKAIFHKYDDTTVETAIINKLNFIICGFNPKEALPVECYNDYITKRY